MISNFNIMRWNNSKFSVSFPGNGISIAEKKKENKIKQQTNKKKT